MMSLHNGKILLKNVFAGALISLVAACPVLADTKAFSNQSDVQVRKDTSAASEITGRLRDKQELSILGKSNGFMKISLDGETGYVNLGYVSVYEADGIANVDNVSVKASDGSGIIGQLNRGDKVNVTGTSDKFLRITYNDSTAFVHSEYIDCEFKSNLITVDGPPDFISPAVPTYAIIAVEDTLNVRTEPNLSASLVTTLPAGEIVDVIELNSSWAKIKTDSGAEGYVSTEFIVIETGEKPAKAIVASKGDELISFAKKFLGTPYVYGGTNLTRGVDCSGFVYSVYRNFGITLNRTSSSMPANGARINKSDLVAGDLVFFSNNGAKNIQHVGIYCGDGTFIHSSSGRAMRVMVSRLNESYYVTNYITAVRVLR